MTVYKTLCDEGKSSQISTVPAHQPSSSYEYYTTMTSKQQMKALKEEAKLLS